MRTFQARLTVVVTSLAVLCAAFAVLVATGVVGGPLAPYAPVGDNRPLLVALPFGVGVVVLAQLARLRVPAGGGYVRLAWGEASIVILCASVPASLVPLVMLGGVALSHSAIRVLDARAGRRRSRGHLLYSVSALTVAGTLAVASTAVVDPTYGHALDVRAVVALCAGALMYSVFALLLVSLQVVAVRGGRLGRMFAEMFSTKLLMVIGNIAIGLLVVWVCATDAFLLVLLPPVLWLLHQFYGTRLTESDDRRTWHDFAEATRDLNRLDEHEAASAGVAWAERLLVVTGVQVALTASGRTYGELPETGEVTVRQLIVGEVQVGELRLAGLTQPRPRDRLILSAFSDALAAALHDAATHYELRNVGERTTYDAVHDPLTGLLNRAALLLKGNGAVRRRAPDDPVAMLVLDINDFKEVNNVLGHDAGDEVIKTIARRVADTGNVGDLIARLGGDEFALLITDLSASGADLALAAAVEQARKLGTLIAVPMEIGGIALSKEASIGVVVAAAGEVDMTELLRRSDIAMYQAKRGGQPVAWYDPGRDDASTDRLALLAELREALNTGEQLTLELQPAVSLQRGAPAGGPVTGVEALVRWKHPRRGKLMPDQFLPTVEASELMGPLTMRVLDLAIGLAASWRKADLAVPVSVNISARSLTDRQLPDRVARLLARYRLPAELLVLEITESVMLSQSPVIDDVLARIHELGVQLAVDDFGTGYSSFTVLTRVPVQEVKIDKEFVAQMFDSPKADAIVRATVELATRLNLRVVAEGVETAEQRAALVALGCTAAQGFLFYPPLAAERVITVLRERRQSERRHLRSEDTG